MSELWHFIRHFLYLVHFVRGVFVALITAVIACAVLFMLAEGLPFGESMYASAITALTVGYGDVTPKTIAGRIISIVIAALGVLFSGLVVAVATRALADAVRDGGRLRPTWQEPEQAPADDEHRGA